MRARTMYFLMIVAAGSISVGVSAQAPPVIHGVTGTLATEGTIKEEHKAANKIIVTTKDGVDHVYDTAKDLLVHGGKDGLADLKPGTTVVVHYTAEAGGLVAHELDRVDAQGLEVTEGIVTKIDRPKRTITIRYDNNAVETLQLTDRAAIDAGQHFASAPAGTTRIVVYYSEDAGGKVAHYFKTKD